MYEDVAGTPKSLSSVPTKRRLANTPLSSNEIKIRKIETTTDKNDTSVEELCTAEDELALKCAQLKMSVKVKEEKRRKLKLVQTYRTRNNIEDLDKLIEKWMKICQSAISDLYENITTDPKPTLTELIDHLKIEHKLINYNADEEDFFPNEI